MRKLTYAFAAIVALSAAGFALTSPSAISQYGYNYGYDYGFDNDWYYTDRWYEDDGVFNEWYDDDYDFDGWWY